MMHFTFSEILQSLFHSLIYGVIFYLIYKLISTVLTFFRTLPNIIYRILHFSKSQKVTSLINCSEKQKCCGTLVSVYFIIFTIGFLLLSYYSLDGIMRAYTLLISLSSFFLCKRLFDKIFDSVFGFIFGAIFYCLGLILCPIRRFFSFIYRKFTKSTYNYFK